jgi:two-component sensor histidine kinase
VYLDLHRIVPCGLFVNELVTNSFKHAFPGGRGGEILIRLHTVAEAEVVLTVSDTGIGLSPGFELDNAQSLGLGLQLVPLFAEQIHGSLCVGTGPGTRFELSFSTATRG